MTGDPQPDPSGHELELARERLESVDFLEELMAEASRLARASRAENTLRGYRSDWADFSDWCVHHRLAPLPATPETVALYMAALVTSGAASGTISRRLSSIRHRHLLAGVPEPTADPGVRHVMQGIRRTRQRPLDQATPLMPPVLFDVLDASPLTYLTKDKRRPPEPSLLGARDRALLMVGFVGALRRSELAAARVENLREHPHGLLLEIPRSKTNQTGDQPELVVLPQAKIPAHCPVVLLRAWLDLAGVHEGPLFRAITPRGNRLRPQTDPLSEDQINRIVQASVGRAGIDPDRDGYSAHSLRAGFATYAASRGISDRAIQNQTRHKHPSTVRIYTRHESAWTDNAATELGL